MLLSNDTEYQVRSGLKEAISLLCKTGIKFNSELSIDGLLAVTLDRKEIFLIKIKENIKSGNELFDISSGRSSDSEDEPVVAVSELNTDVDNVRDCREPHRKRQVGTLEAASPKHLGDDTGKDVERHDEDSNCKTEHRVGKRRSHTAASGHNDRHGDHSNNHLWRQHSELKRRSIVNNCTRLDHSSDSSEVELSDQSRVANKLPTSSESVARHGEEEQITDILDEIESNRDAETYGLPTNDNKLNIIRANTQEGDYIDNVLYDRQQQLFRVKEEPVDAMSQDDDLAMFPYCTGSEINASMSARAAMLAVGRYRTEFEAAQRLCLKSPYHAIGTMSADHHTYNELDLSSPWTGPRNGQPTSSFVQSVSSNL